MKKGHLIVFLWDKMVNWVKLNTKMLNITKKNFLDPFFGPRNWKLAKNLTVNFSSYTCFLVFKFCKLNLFIKGRASAKIKFLTLFILLFSTNPYFRGILDQKEDRNLKNLKKERSNYKDFSTGPFFPVI